jgi:hypothetical protein
VASGRESKGQALAALGGLGLVASLWTPWYSIEIPQAAINSVTQMAKQLGALGPLITQGAQLINQLGPFHVTAWQAFNTTPAVLLVTGVIAGGLAFLALTDRAGNTSQLTMLAGVVAAMLVGYRLAVPPGQGGFVHPAWGIYLALVSALLMLVGGGLAGSDRGPAVPVMATHTPPPPAPSPPPAAPGPAATAHTSFPGPSGATAGWSDPPAQQMAAGWSDLPAQSAAPATWLTSESVPPPKL